VPKPMALVVVIKVLPGRVDGAIFWNWWIYRSSGDGGFGTGGVNRGIAPMMGMEVRASAAVMHDGCFGINNGGGSHSTGN